MIPDNLPLDTPLVCIEATLGLAEGKTYLLDYYEDTNRVVVRERNALSSISGCWYLRRFKVLNLPDGADYQAADDCDLSCEPFTNGRN